MARLSKLREIAFWWLSVAAIKAGGPALMTGSNVQGPAGG